MNRRTKGNSDIPIKPRNLYLQCIFFCVIISKWNSLQQLTLLQAYISVIQKWQVTLDGQIIISLFSFPAPLCNAAFCVSL